MQALANLRDAMESHPSAMALDATAKAILSAHAATVRAARALGAAAPKARARRCRVCGLLVVQLGAGTWKEAHDHCRHNPRPRQKPARPPESPPTAPAAPLCDFCGRTHAEPRDAHDCALRASRAAADVAARRRW